MSNDTRVAIFVDAENLTLWLKQNGVEGLLEELSSLGTVVVRKAYARWTSEGVMPKRRLNISISERIMEITATKGIK